MTLSTSDNMPNLSFSKGVSPFVLAAPQAALAAQTSLTLDTASPVLAKKPKKAISKLFICCIVGSNIADLEDTLTSRTNSQQLQAVLPQVQILMSHASGSPRKHLPPHFALKSQRSSNMSEYFDCASNFSGCIDQYQSGIDGDVATIKETQPSTLIVKELAPLKADWIPETPLAFGTPDMKFMPIPAVTGFAGYWARDESRCGPFLLPIGELMKLTVIGKRVHQSIPGIHIKETDTELSVLAKPGFIPPLIKFDGYLEQYDKSNKTEHSWAPRLDLKIGKGYGKLFLTADGTLVCRVWHRGAFSNKVEVILEHYLQLEEGGNSIKATFNALQVSTGKRVTDVQYGTRSPAPTK